MKLNEFLEGNSQDLKYFRITRTLEYQSIKNSDKDFKLMSVDFSCKFSYHLIS